MIALSYFFRHNTLKTIKKCRIIINIMIVVVINDDVIVDDDVKIR